MLDRDTKLLVGARPAGDHALQPVTSRPDPRLQRTHHVARSDDVVPAREHLPAQERTAAQRVLDLPARRGVRQVDLRPQLRRGGELLGPGPLDRAGARGEARQRAAQRPPDQIGTGLRVGRQPVQPPAHRRERRPREHAVLERDLRDDEQVRVEPLLAQHLAHVARHLTLGVVGNAVEHDGQRRPAVVGVVQELPGDGIGVPQGGRHEQPGVGRGEQLVGQRAVLREHRVDVRRIEEREAGRQRGPRHELQHPRRRRAAGRPRELGKDPIVLEPPHVVGMARQDRRTRRRAKDPSGADHRPDEAVDERRLPGAGRAADDHQHRGVHALQARQQVVVGLGDEVVAGPARVGRACDPELEAHGREVVSEAPDRVGQLGSHRIPANTSA